MIMDYDIDNEYESTWTKSCHSYFLHY